MNLNEFVPFYQDHLQAPFFTAFLVLSGFLFSVKTFLITNLIKEIYSDRDYHQHVLSSQQYATHELQIMKPVRNLSNVLLGCILLSLLTSVLQFTLGFEPRPIASITCSCFAIASVLSVLFALYLVRASINDWIDFIESRARRKHALQLQEDSEITPKSPQTLP